MQITILLSLLLPSFALADGPATRPAIQLFNGTNLADWYCVIKVGQTATATRPDNVDDYWYVKNGILHDKGNPYGYIRNSGVYSNYILTVEQRHLDKGNGGIFIAMDGPDKIWGKLLEMQGLVGEEGDIRGIANYKLTGDPVRTDAKHIRKIGPSSEKPVGEWETLVVTVNHGKLTLVVNGVLQNEATYEGDLTGNIGLQAEGGEMEFRKVEILPIE